MSRLQGKVAIITGGSSGLEGMDSANSLIAAVDSLKRQKVLT
jgi:NADP-dependent 3-hydroxy acid dehydrogenase YdfG